MKIAIIGANVPDSLEFNLQEAFSFAGYNAEIFDVYDSRRYHINSKVSLCFRTLDVLGRRYSEAYDLKVFRRIAHRVLEFKPNLVVGVYRFIHPEFVKIIKSNSIPVIHVNPDAITTFEAQQLFVESYDVYFTKDPYIQRFMKENMKLNTRLYSEAFNIRLHKRPNISKKVCEEEINTDVMTYGTMYPYRIRMLSQLLKQDINLKVYGVKPHRYYNHSLDAVFQNKYIIGEEKARLLYGSKIVFNQMHFAEVESVNNRFFEVNGCGAFQLSDYRPILHDLLPVDPELVSFKNIDEGLEKVKFYLNHDEERYQIADKVYQHFVERYSYDKLIAYLLKETFSK